MRAVVYLFHAAVPLRNELRMAWAAQAWHEADKHQGPSGPVKAMLVEKSLLIPLIRRRRPESRAVGWKC